ncbi:MAG: DUF1360 domain-containing protein [Ardenticatenaceae bacterium]|nr:DUF1360 domain-containing protein [Ardenticatenaceae bacterium]HBY98947.1 hypothetical protein [Chloroflexota bacterium]
MSSRHARMVERVERRATYTTLSAIFLAIFGAFTLRLRREREDLQLQPLDLVQLGFATYRLGRLTAYDKVAETYRAPFTETIQDQTGAGKTVVPEGMGVQRALGELVSCPICAGTWIAAALVYGLNLAPRPTRTFLAVMSSVGVAELLNAATEFMQWTGQAERKEAGS